MKMTTTFQKSVLSALCLLMVSMSTHSQFGKRIEGSKNYVTKDISVSEFDAIRLIGSSDIEYFQNEGKRASAQIYGSDNLIDLLDVQVINRTLTVKFKEKNNVSYNNGKLKVIASSPSIKSVSLEGSGDIVLNSNINAADLDIIIRGSGDIKSNRSVNCTSAFSAQLSGSGDIDLKGNIHSNICNLKLEGSGDIAATELNASSGSILLNGSGNIEVKGRVNINDLEVVLNGSGDIGVDNIKSSSFTGILRGSGDVKLRGNTRDANLEVNNSGSIKAADLKAENVDATVRGSGNINCYASRILRATVRGSGNIGYKGNPSVESDSPKSGRIRKL